MSIVIANFSAAFAKSKGIADHWKIFELLSMVANKLENPKNFKDVLSKMTEAQNGGGEAEDGDQKSSTTPFVAPARTRLRCCNEAHIKKVLEYIDETEDESMKNSTYISAVYGDAEWAVDFEEHFGRFPTEEELMARLFVVNPPPVLFPEERKAFCNYKWKY